MVNTGRPSRGCHACRKRRIKCDQTLAGCQRCAKIGVVCPGYRPESELRFRNATIASSSGLSALPLAITVGPDNIQSPAPWPVLLSEEAANPYSSTSNRIIQRHCGESENNSSADSSDVEDQTSDWSLDAISSRTPRSPGVGSALQLPLEIRSVCFFMHQYTLPTSQLEPHGWMAFMPHLYSQATDDSCLRLAVTATAYANAARQWCIPDQLDNARQYYGKTLWALKAALRDPGKVIEDATLGCIIALTVFEVRFIERDLSTIPAEIVQQYISDDIDKGFGSHQDGYKKLLLLRESQHVNTPNAANLFSNVISQLVSPTIHSGKYNLILIRVYSNWQPYDFELTQHRKPSGGLREWKHHLHSPDYLWAVSKSTRSAQMRSSCSLVLVKSETTSSVCKQSWQIVSEPIRS